MPTGNKKQPPSRPGEMVLGTAWIKSILNLAASHSNKPQMGSQEPMAPHQRLPC
jgi:hypothetical protein